MTFLSVKAARLVVAGLIFAAPLSSAHAQQAGMLDLKPIRVSAKSTAGQGGAKFDWLAGRTSKAQATPRVVQTRFIGKGKWICSPAGFGKKASCFQR
ncbi:hypothetical protein BMI91_02795 [Thioclava sediminum]|uniref:Uncharacterized protein n=1 Tax=Thioclava sediminum TaxID=1915319 RepID=A0ABX3N1P5_9RHOB|nr:hypothetical protein BMI87_02425 [Thioclava sp. F28-4]OOY10396.1 hypothetical protein BMI89_00305 [Thioclava sp. F36-7]OOY17849.1 hypothetical protein BMI85_02570 [Thioclava sp. DLFJ4-1]OOY21497.1 hypothetical protein BMI86_02730 [Thioclava sp. DLFJ5-1]OOY25359.1 hypothetical protein BMI91_02795 [Thioclava sediminum]OOY33122.1 hypothetical protein BMI88_04500 [Thioclava sp. F36-6]